jgi:hypothetical protein
MFTLENTQLRIFILDPEKDRARLGSRYCTGGCIWQAEDERLGPLFTGPEYPKEPNTFDGQGAPEMFKRALGADTAAVGDEVGCIGVGRVRRTSPLEPFDVRHNREVIEFVKWDIALANDSVTMSTMHTFRDWSYELTRRVSLNERTFESVTTLRNTGAVSLPVCWFAHPFFPIPPDGVLCRFSIPIGMPESLGYLLKEDGHVYRKPTHDWSRGCYCALDLKTHDRVLHAIQRYPQFSEIAVETDFPPSALPIWGNDRTFSFEPYFERTLSANEEAHWGVAYHCGAGVPGAF